MSDRKNFELKPGFTYISERTSQYRYADTQGKVQFLQPLSRYKALTEIKRGMAVSVVTSDELEEKLIKINSIDPIVTLHKALLNNELTVSEMESFNDGKTYPTKITKTYESDIGYAIEEVSTYGYKEEDGSVVQTLTSRNHTVFENLDKQKSVKLPLTVTESRVNYASRKETSVENEDWENDVITITTTYDVEVERTNGVDSYVIVKTVNAYSNTPVDEGLEDPDPYVVPTDTTIHERTIGLSLEYAENYGDLIHVQPYGKFVYQPAYENVNEGFYNGTTHDEFTHEGHEYNPGFTYKDVGKKVFIAYPENGEYGRLTVDGEKVSKFYHNIICLGYLTDAPQVAGESNTEIEISISGDQRGLLDATQIEARLGEDVVMSSNDPIRVFAYGNESDTKFKARLCFTPQAGTLKNTDFIAFQKMDGNTGIIYFTEGEFNFDGVFDDDDVAFLHMAKCYADITEDGKIYTKSIKINDTQTAAAVASNIEKFYDPANDVNVLNEVFTKVTGNEDSSGLEIKYHSDATNPFGYIEMEAKEVGGYYAMYISSGLKSKFDGSITTCHGSYENHGLAVLADIRIPERRDILGIYYGSRWDELLEKGYTTIFMRLGEFDVPEESKQLGGFTPGHAYYLGMNGRVVKAPYNQYDFVNKIGTVKYSNDDDLRFVVDIGSSTRHYNGDLPVGYMKPAIYTGTGYVAEYGFALMDGVTQYPKAHPYDEIYKRLLGWFDANDVEIPGSDYFKIPLVFKMTPDEVVNEDGTTTFKQVQVPMQIKWMSTGIYEEMPRIPFKRFFGQFDLDQVKKDDDWTPIKCAVPDCDITDIIDYGICDEGYTKPGIDNLDIHLYIDPDENYKSGPHNWREVPVGYFNYNNATTFGYEWSIVEEEASDAHPYGVYKLHMVVGKGEGVAYVTDSNQAPKKLNNCYYKLYVARREVFTRQFDIEKIYKDYLTNSIYTDDTKSEVVLTKAVTGKAVLDAINNRYLVNTLVGAPGGDIEFGSLKNPVGTLVFNTSGNLPIIAAQGISLQNEQDNGDSATKVPKVTFKDGVFKKEGDYSNISPTDTENELKNNVYNYIVDGNEIATVKQIRDHATLTIDDKTYNVGAGSYAKATTKTGLVHGMIFGQNGNVDASTLWGIKPSISADQQIAELDPSQFYIPVYYNDKKDGFEFTLNGTTVYRDVENKDTLKSEKVSTASLSNFIINDSNQFASEDGKGTNSVVTEVDSKYSKIAYFFEKNGTRKVTTILDLDNGILSLAKNDGNTASGLMVVAGGFTSGSRSEFKRVYGELIRDENLVSDDDLVEGSKHYSENYTTTVVPESDYGDKIEYKFEENTNKFKTVLGSALQAAYELPLAYWQYNTEKEWYKDSLGVIVQRVESVAENIKGKTYATVKVGSLTVTAKEYSDDENISVTLKRLDKTTNEVEVATLVDGVEVDKQNVFTIGDLVDNKYVTFSGVADANLLIPEIMDGETVYTATLTGGRATGTERRLFDKLNDTDGSTHYNTTPARCASLTVDGFTITAKEEGLSGNNIAVKSTYTQDDERYDIEITVKGTEYHAKYEGKDVEDIHVLEQQGVAPEDKYVTFSVTEGTNGELTVFDTTYLNGGADGKAVSENLITTDYKENEYQYTSEEADSIREFLTTIIDNSSNGQNITSTVGMLLCAAKETQERLLRVEASTFGRDYEQIPGAHEPYVLTDMPGIVPDPTNYGLNRLIRAICQELYYDSNPFDEALANGKTDVNVSSFSRIDRLDREIHGESNNDEDGLTTAPNNFRLIESTTYPYEDMIRAKDDTEVRESPFTKDQSYLDLAKARGTNVLTRVDMMTYNKNIDGDYVEETNVNISNDTSHFNGIIDAIYRITTKLNALTESINNGDNIANSPIRLNTIRQNIEHIIRETYFDDTDNFVPGEEELAGESQSGHELTKFINVTKDEAVTYHDVGGENHKAYTKDLSRFDKLTDNLYNYVISLDGEAIASFGDFYELGDEKVIEKTPVRDPATGEVSIVETEKQVYYTGRKFNGKHLLLDSNKTKDGTEAVFDTENHIPQNLNDYNYATLLDIVVDALGPEFFRKQVNKKITKDDSRNNIEELRHNRTISERLDLIEGCLDKVVAKISRQHSFEEETDITNNNDKNGKESNQTVFSIDRYIQFMNEYLGYFQTTDNDVYYGSNNEHHPGDDYSPANSSNKYSTDFTAHWANGFDRDLNGANANIDGNPGDDKFASEWASHYGQAIGTTEFSAEYAFKNKKNIHAGLVNVLSRLQNEEARSTNLDAILGKEYESQASAITTTYSQYDDEEAGVKSQTATSTYTLTDDMMDILMTIYGKDSHNAFQNEDKGSYTSYKHRSLVGSTNKNVRFVSGEEGNNIIDAIINELYFLPRPVRAYNATLDSTVVGDLKTYFTDSAADGASYNSGNVYLPTDNSITEQDSVTGKTIRDSRIASYYDFDQGKNYYDIPDNEYALSWNNRDEFFGDLGRPAFKDKDIDQKRFEVEYAPVYRKSRFEVIENEIRKLRHLIGLDFGNWNGQEDLVNLKFNGELKFFGDRVNNGFSGNPFGTNLRSGNVVSFTNQFNGGESIVQSADTNILKFLLNVDKSERLLRAELGFSSNNWAKIKPDTQPETSGYDYWYDWTYNTTGKGNKESLLSSGIKDGDTTYDIYGLFGQQTDDTYENRHSVYDRLLALEQNAVRVDAWLDSVKNIHRSDVGNGKGSGSGNIYDIVNYLGNYTWVSPANHYYGEFGKLDKPDAQIGQKNTSEAEYETVTAELNAHHEYLTNIYDVIGIDAHAENAEHYVGTEYSSGEAREDIKKANTIWARLNAVELLNQNDVDITNVVTVKEDIKATTANNWDYTGKTPENVAKVMQVGKNIEESLVTSLDAWKSGSAELIASKGYVDSIAQYWANYVHKMLGDIATSAIKINDTDISNNNSAETLSLNDEKESKSNVIVLADRPTDAMHYYNTVTVVDLVDAINSVNKKEHSSLNNVYSNLNNLLTALQYTYDNDMTQTTTGSLLVWEQENNGGSAGGDDNSEPTTGNDGDGEGTDPVVTEYTITVSNTENGTVTASAEKAEAGTKITLTITSNDGYELDTVTVKNGEEDVTVTEDNTFILPEGNVTVTVTFKAAASTEPSTEPSTESGNGGEGEGGEGSTTESGEAGNAGENTPSDKLTTEEPDDGGDNGVVGTEGNEGEGND